MFRSRMPGLLAVPILSVSLLLTATPTLAQGTLDQSQTDAPGRIALGSARPLGQTFTAGITGALDRVAIYPRGDYQGSTVQIRATSGGLPTDTILGSGTLQSSTSMTFVAVDLDSPAAVVAGTQYAIVFLSASGPDLGSSLADENPYAAGEVVFILPDGVTWSSFNADLAFRTYVDTTYGFAWESPTKGKGRGVNKPSAGTTVPVAFSLDTRVRASQLLAPGWPKVRRVDCSTHKPKAGTEWMSRPFGAQGLTRVGRQYTYAWRVRPEWGTGALACRELRIKLTDGTSHSALYRFQPAR